MRVSFEGKCTVERASELRDSLLQALNAGKSIDLDFQGVTAMDMSFCQLIHALRASCKEQGKRCELQANLPPELGVFAQRCGLPELAPQPPDGDAAYKGDDVQ